MLPISNRTPLLELLRSEDAAVRVSALQFLVQNPHFARNEEVVILLKPLADEPDGTVRFWARKVIAELERSVASHNVFDPSLQKLRKILLPTDLHPENIQERVQACISGQDAIDLLKPIVDLRRSEFLDSLISILETSKDVRVIAYLVKSLGCRFPQDRLIPLIGKFLDHDDDRVSANAIEGLENIGSSNSIGDFARLLDHKSHRVRANAAKALSKFDAVIAGETLEQMLRDKDHPHIIIGACHAIKQLKAESFLSDLVPLVGDPLISESALEAISSIFENTALKFMDGLLETRHHQAIRERILYELQERLGKRHIQGVNPWNRPWDKENANILLEIGEQKIFSYEIAISREEAQKRALENHKELFNLWSRLWYRPRDGDIELTYSETRYEPFWHVSCKLDIDFTRSRNIEILIDSKVQELKIGDRLVSVESSKLAVPVFEHLRDEITKETWIDAQTGSSCDFSRYAEKSRREIKEIKEIRDAGKPMNSRVFHGNAEKTANRESLESKAAHEVKEVIVIPPRIKASIIIRDLLAELMKPIKADEINDERIRFSLLNLCFRPVHAFEFTWKSREQQAVMEIDAVTGDIVPGRTVKQSLSEVFSETTLFEIGTDAAGLIIPGGDIAIKLARAVFSK
ncbi:MAG: HEAT repeat domain-containing protein [Candidatus Ozemobacteraceae bacterium]